MRIEHDVSLLPFNTFGLPATAGSLIRIQSQEDIQELLAAAELRKAPKFVLGGGSNIVLTQDTPGVVLKIEIMGRRILEANQREWIIEAGAGESWPDLVAWCLANGWPGLENLALIPGTVGAAPIQNIGAYGVELKDRFDSLQAVDLTTAEPLYLDKAACRFGYRDSIFKHDLAGRCIITHVRLRLPKRWEPVLDYPDLKRKLPASGPIDLNAQQVFEWVCGLRRAKLPDPKVMGNAGSFFKNPVVAQKQLSAIREKHPEVASHATPEGLCKLSAGWLIERCGWKGKTMGQVSVYEHQALVLVNQGGATGQQVLALAKAIQESVYERFGIGLEIEPNVL